MLQRTLLTSALLAVALFAFGCGGNTNTAPKPAPLPTASFDIAPERDSVLVAGDIKVTVPKGTFTKVASITVTRTIASNLPQIGGFVPFADAQCKIVTSERPTGPITLQSVSWANRRSDDTRAVFRYLQLIDGTWRVLNDVADDVRMVVNKAAFSAINAVDGVIGSFVVNVPESGSRLLYMGGNPIANQYNVLIIVHGFNSRADDFWLAANRLAIEPMEERFRAIYGFEYDYRQSCRASALALVEQIRVLRDDYPIFRASSGSAPTPPELIVFSADTVMNAYAYPLKSGSPCWPPSTPKIAGDESSIQVTTGYIQYLIDQLASNGIEKAASINRSTITHESGHLKDFQEGKCQFFHSFDVTSSINSVYQAWLKRQGGKSRENPLFKLITESYVYGDGRQGGHPWDNQTETYASVFALLNRNKTALDAGVNAYNSGDPVQDEKDRAAIKSLETEVNIGHK